MNLFMNAKVRADAFSAWRWLPFRAVHLGPDAGSDAAEVGRVVRADANAY